MDSFTRRPRQDMPIYVPAHRRVDPKEPEREPASPVAPVVDTSDTLIKRGRGSFRGKTSGASNANGSDQSHSPRGRNFDATVLRTYSDGGKKKSNGNDGGNSRRGGKVSGRRGSKIDDVKLNGHGVANQGSDDGGDVKSLTDGAFKAAFNGVSETTSSNDATIDGLAESFADTSISSPPPDSPLSQKEEWELLMEREPLSVNKSADDENSVTSQRKESNASIKQRKRRASRIEILPEGAEAPTPDEPTFVLDCYDFSASFKTHHLHDIFREYENMRGGYRIKWLEDTRALIIFEHPATAKKAYLDNVANPLTKIRPYTGPISVKRSSSPPRRPATTDMVAKRLVAGALGVKVSKTPEQKAADKAVLQSARDQREQQRNQAAIRSQELDAAFND